MTQGPQVEYSLRAIPLGGYVGFPDDDPESPYPPDDPDLLRNKVCTLLGSAFRDGCGPQWWLRQWAGLSDLDPGATAYSAKVMRGRPLTKTRTLLLPHRHPQRPLRREYQGCQCLPKRCAQGIAGRALVISAGIIANIIFAYSILLAQVLLRQLTCWLSDAVPWPVDMRSY